MGVCVRKLCAFVCAAIVCDASAFDCIFENAMK